ncbi:MAG: heme-dependent oxidative N-demethylase subunit alpha family protein [Gammaproteobacteria bacterium]
MAGNSLFQAPPWGDGYSKYRLGLNPIHEENWFNEPISKEVFEHKFNLLNNNYSEVVAATEDSLLAQQILAKNIPTLKCEYPDPIADTSLLVPDDLCLIESNGKQRMLAASVCSPSYWNVQDKIGKSLYDVHAPVKSLNKKIGKNIGRFIERAPLLQPFERENWLIHTDTKRFHLVGELEIVGNPDNWFVRSERETICKIHDDYSLFTIRVAFAPIKEIHAYESAKAGMLKSLMNMDKDEINYFGGAKKVKTLIEYLNK